jgi:hypothetical protein
MGCDIHSFTEQCDSNDAWHFVPWQPIGKYNRAPFDNRSYGVFGFLANVRNYSHVPTIVEPRGMPKSVSDVVTYEFERWQYDAHSIGWLTVQELVKFDYDQKFENRRYTKQVTPNYFVGSAVCESGEGIQTTVREFLGTYFFQQLEQLTQLDTLHNTRIVFWFDN